MKTERSRDNEDRISMLPEFLIHQILSYLPPKEAARTTALSKTWLQSYSTSPFLTFNECFFGSAEIVGNKYPFFNFVNKTLLRYIRLNLRIHKLEITVSGVDHEPAYRLLDESLGVAFDNGVQELSINVKSALDFSAVSITFDYSSPYTLPSAIFDSPKLLTYLRADQCKFPQNVSKCSSINFPLLQTLVIYRSYIDDGMLQKLLLSSPSLEKIFFYLVSGFEKFRIRNLEKLKILNISNDNTIEIDIEDAPTLRLLKYRSSFSFERPCFLKVGSALHIQSLKRLELYSVSIRDRCLKDLIKKSPLLEDLQIDTCDELERVYILSSSLKHLDFRRCKMLVEARIDAPNLLELRYDVGGTAESGKQARVNFRIWSLNQGIEFGIAHDSRENPLPLKHQHQTVNFMRHVNQSSSLFVVFVVTLFSCSRPATIDTCFLNNVEFVKFLSNELMITTRNPDCCSSVQTKCWRHYLKDIKVEVYDDSHKLWHTLLEESALSELSFSGQSIRFCLKWYANLIAEV